MTVRTPTILVVDDDAFVRASVKETLAGAGFHILEAKDGEEALARVGESLPDLVILDLLMPNLSGLDVLARLRAASADLRVLVLSSFDAPSLVEEARRHGANEFLAKPFHPIEMLSGVRRLLGA